MSAYPPRGTRAPNNTIKYAINILISHFPGRLLFIRRSLASAALSSRRRFRPTGSLIAECHMTDASAMVMEAYYTALCSDSGAASDLHSNANVNVNQQNTKDAKWHKGANAHQNKKAERQFGRRCYVVDFDGICEGNVDAYNTLADALQVPREKIWSFKVGNGGCPPKDYPEEEVLVATTFFIGRSKLYPHAAVEPT